MNISNLSRSGQRCFGAGKYLALASLLFLLLPLASCGGGSGSGAVLPSSGVEMYYHWTCNGDAGCLKAMSMPSGTLDEGAAPLPGQTNCSAMMAIHGTAQGWSVPPAKEWCDYSPTIKPLSAIIVTPSNPDLNQNYPRQLTATAVYTDGTTGDITSQVTWTSGSQTVATIDANGVATGASIGSTTVYAQLGSVSGKTSLSVTSASLNSLTITPANVACVPNAIRQLYAVGVFSDGSSYVIANGVSWSSSANTVAGIGTAGLVNCISTGSANISATDGTITANSVLPVYSTVHYAYSANSASSSVAQYTIGSDGSLTAMSPATVATITADTIAIDPSGKYLYLGSNGGNLAQFSIGSSGALTAMSPATVTAGNVSSIAVNSSGKYLYATDDNANGNVYQFTIGSGGALTPMATPSVAAGDQPVSIAVDPADRFVYVLNTGSSGAGSISEYDIGSGGALASLGTATVSSGSQPDAIAVDPSGRYVYVANYGGTMPASIAQYYINSDGTLSPMAVSNVVLATTCGPKAMAIGPAQHIYVACGGDNSIAEFGIGSDGTLTALASGTIATTDSPVSVAVDASGQYVYASYYGSSSTPVSGIDQYSIGADGTLTQLATPTAATGSDPGPVITTW